MEDYNKSSHAIYRCEYHFFWVPKYRYHVLVKEIKPRVKEVLVELCNWLDITIIGGGFIGFCKALKLSIPNSIASFIYSSADPFFTARMIACLPSSD
jgi:hypothetical protein